uniref:Uncharacterized protein n=1 Tax=Arundo donax TaxID=35708 RepID=A0A0A9AIB1_ARUDO
MKVMLKIDPVSYLAPSNFYVSVTLPCNSNI